MRIKPNLLKGASGSFHVKNGPKDKWGSKSFVLPELKDGEKYTAYFRARDLNAITNGNVSCIISNLQEGNDLYRFINLKASKTVSIDFIYKKGRSEKIYFYPGKAGNAYNCEGTFYNIKLVEGDGDDLYSPCKDDLDPCKQAIFVAGGGIPRGVSTLSCQGVGYVS